MAEGNYSNNTNGDMPTSSTANIDAPTDQDWMNLLYNKCGSPMKDRGQTEGAMRALCGQTSVADYVDRPPHSNVYGDEPLVLSDIPETCRNSDNGIILGIDEAGRGSVVGPMVYGMCFWHLSAQEANKIPKDFNDSKQLSEPQREKLYETILKTPEIGFSARVLHASEISRNMLRREPYNLNQMSHDAAISMIRNLVDRKIAVQICYIDTVGNPASYTRRLEREFPGIEFIVESKADYKYAPCSAASIGTCR